MSASRPITNRWGQRPQDSYRSIKLVISAHLRNEETLCRDHQRDLAIKILFFGAVLHMRPSGVQVSQRGTNGRFSAVHGLVSCVKPWPDVFHLWAGGDGILSQSRPQVGNIGQNRD